MSTSSFLSVNGKGQMASETDSKKSTAEGSDTPPEKETADASTLTTEDWLSVIGGLTGGAFFAVDAERNVIAYSPEMESLTGLRREQVIGRHCLNAFRCADCLKGCGVYDTGDVAPTNVTIHHPNGSDVNVIKSARVVRNSDGEAVIGIEVVMPADQSKPDALPEFHVEAPERGLDMALMALGRFFVTADKDLRILRFSGQLPVLLGLTPEELRFLPLEDLLGPELFAKGSNFREAVLNGDRREGFAASMMKKDGQRVPVSLSAASVADPSGSPGSGCATSAAVLIVIRPAESTVRGSQDAEPGLSGMVGRSAVMQDIFRLIKLLRDNDARVLITGESGTGKELVARAIHENSHRAAGPFVAVNCGALPGDLLESELFGHVKGAFTGAIRDKPGRFEVADGGTLFLDEIGDLALPLQVKLLRALEDQTFERVGDTKTRHVDVRVVAATNADLAKAVAERRFRDDLFYRLRVVPIEIPPLRARREDLEPLVHHLLDRIGQRRGRSLRLSPPAMRAMLSYDWPGNVRELENALEYATAVCEGQTIHDTDLPIEVRGLGRAVDPTPHDVTTVERSSIHADGNGPAAPDHRALGRAFDGLEPNEAAEAEMIRSVLEETHYQRQATADRLGMSRWTLWRKMKAYRLR